MINFCTLFSGSSGNCTYVSNGRTKVLVDAGKSGCAVEKSLKNIGCSIEEIDAILVTHEHYDHVKGVGILSRKHNIPVYANKSTWKAMSYIVGKIDESDIKVFDTNKDFEIGTIGIKAFDIPHDASEPVGFNFHIGDKKLTSVTDIGHINDTLFNNLKNSDVILIEANHDVEMVKVCRYPYYLKQRILGDKGHLSNESAGNLICDLINYGVSRVLLGHLSKENNFPELCHKAISNILESKNIKVGKDIKIEVAQRDCESTIYAV